jgi:hypothetical protein
LGKVEQKSDQTLSKTEQNSGQNLEKCLAKPLKTGAKFCSTFLTKLKKVEQKQIQHFIT